MDDPDEDCGGQDIDDPAPEGLTETQKQNIRSIYQRCDIDASGDLSFKELRKCLQWLGLNPTVAEVKAIIKKHGIKGRKIGYDDFEDIMSMEILSKTDAEFDLMEAFRIFDKDKNGYLDRKELKLCLQTLGECMTDAEVDDLFDQLDKDKNGQLSYIEATKLLAP